jgi:hypothetical protein
MASTLPLRRHHSAGQYDLMTKQENQRDEEAPGRKVKARMFLITMLVLFGGTLGVLIYAALRSVPSAS